MGVFLAEEFGHHFPVREVGPRRKRARPDSKPVDSREETTPPVKEEGDFEEDRPSKKRRGEEGIRRVQEGRKFNMKG